MIDLKGRSRTNNTDYYNYVYQPEIFSFSDDKLQWMFDNHPELKIFDQIELQLIDLIKAKNPDKSPEKEFINTEIAKILGETPVEAYGLWVYYGWSDTLVHILPENEFVFLRTNRNKLKITEEEQALLAQKVVGIVGLSVGQSIALTLAMGRYCGEIRLADFDTIDLSNLNRLKAGIHSLGTSKAILAARSIAEIDPFIKVKCFPDGFTEHNKEMFMTFEKTLDLLIEECDNFKVKIEARKYAKQLGIPVLMETNDKCMIDIERFDQNQDYPILHGRIDAFLEDGFPLDENRAAILNAMIDTELLTDRMKASLPEIKKSLCSWPQLASSVVMGAGVASEIALAILLAKEVESGRYFIDLNQIFGLDKKN